MSNYAAFRDTFVRLLDVKAARVFNASLVAFLHDQNMEKFVATLRQVCDTPEKRELFTAVQSVLPPNYQESYRQAFGDELEDRNAKKIEQAKATGVNHISFDLLFLGSGGLPHIPRREDYEDRKLLDLAMRQILDSEIASQAVQIEMTSDSVRTLDTLSGTSLSQLSLDGIVFCDTLGIGSNESEEVVILVHQDPIYEMVVAHYYSCATDTANKVLMAILGENALAARQREDSGHNPFATEASNDEAPRGPLVSLELDRSKICHKRGLGAGQFGMVYLASYTDSRGRSSDVAVKMCRTDTSSEDQEEFAHEAEIMTQLDHPLVVALLGVCMRQKPWMLVLEAMKFGNLKNCLQSALEMKLMLTPRELIFICRQIASALDYVHSMGFVHMDVAARNVLVHNNLEVKLADFGQTQRKDADGVFVLDRVMRLSVRWMAPETLSGVRKVFSERTDVWAFAVTCWEVYMYGRMPFKSLKTEVARDQIMQGKARLTSRPPTTCPTSVWEVLVRCWDYSPKQRPSFKELVRDFEKLEGDYANEAPPRDVGSLIRKQPV